MKYVFRILGVLAMAAVLLHSQSCGPVFPEPPAPEKVLLDEDFMAYVGLPDHSYWIYRNVETGEIDSSYIGGTDTTMQDYNYGRQIVEYLHENRHGVLYLKGVSYRCRWYTSKGLATGEIRKFNYLGMQLNSEGGRPIVAFKDSAKIWEYNDNNLEKIYTSFIETVDLNGREYNDVVHVSTAGGWESDVSIKEVCYVKGVGPVYRKFADGSEWELIRYHIGNK